MSSMLPSQAPNPSFADRRRRGVAMLGALLTPEQTASSGVPAGLDFVVLVAPVAAAIVAAQPLPTLILLASLDELAGALETGAVELIACVPIDGVTLLDSFGRARLVTSPVDARAAFANGADLVIYDVPTMMSELFGSLAAGRRPSLPEAGVREPLVLLSGMLGDQTLWDGISARLIELVLPWPARIDLDDSIPEMAASVLAQAPARFTLAGHSLGAIVALEILRQAPDRVTRAVLVNASARGPSPAQQEVWQTWQERTSGGAFRTIKEELARATLAPQRRTDKQMVCANAAMAETVGEEGFLRQLAAQATRPDSLASLAEIRVPILVVSGEQDDICPPILQREIVDRCGHAELVTIAEAGHMVPLEDPAGLALHLRKWLTAASL